MTPRRQKIAFVASTSVGGLFLAGAAAVLLWPDVSTSPRQSSPRKTTLEYPIPVRVGHAKADPKASQDLARVTELERKRDAEGLAKIALAKADGEAGARLRVTALHAMAGVGGEKAAAVLRDVLASEKHDLVLRLAAATALARTGGDAEVAYLRERLNEEPSRIVKEKIRLALESRKS